MTKKILIIQTAFIGDVILASSLARAIKKREPTTQIDFVLRKGNESLLHNHPDINHLWIWDKKNNKYLNLLKLALELKGNNYNEVYTLQRYMNASLLCWLSGAPIRAGFSNSALSFVFTHKIEHRIPHYLTNGDSLHEVQRNFLLYMNVHKLINIPQAKELRPSLYPSKEDQHKIDKFLAQNKINKYIVLAPSSVWFTKRWPQNKWQKFIEKYHNEYSFIIIGAKEDKEYCDQIAQKQNNVFNTCGQLSLLQSAAIMQKAYKVISNDSAPLHLASSVNAASIGIFCGTDPSFGFTALSDDSSSEQLHPPLKCMPCGLHGKNNCPLGHFKCGEDLSIEL